MAHDPKPGSDTRGLSLAARRLLAIVLYYVTVGIALALTWRFWPAARQLLTETLVRPFDGGLLTGPVTADTITRAGGRDLIGGAIPGTASLQARDTLLVLAGALAASIPVAWVYSLTRRRRGFTQSLVHILVLLPLAVAGMVVLIQNSLALAFSLAGIVAVLRFRNSIEDVKDGVYVFIAVTIGMSSAVGALAIGAVTSMVFNVSVLVLWWLDFARRPTPGIRGAWRRLARLPRVVPPNAGSGKRAPAGDAAGDKVFASAARAWRRQLQITAEHAAAGSDDRYNASLHVLTSAPDASRVQLEEVLRTWTKRFTLTGIMPGEGTGSAVTLKYRVLVRRSERDPLLDAVRAAPQTVGVELR